MRKFLLFLFMLCMLLAASFACSSGVQGQKSSQNSLALQGFVWNHTTLKVLVLPAENESWWSSTDLNTALRAVGQWNDAISAFSSNYSDYTYLSNLKLQLTVSNTVQPGFDIYIDWTEFSLSNTTDEIGLSQFTTNYDRTLITKCVINLATHTHHGTSLNEADMQNVALHELGHSLGLGHGNYTGDLMYAFYTTGSPAEAVSTLDAYGVAALFAWTLNPASFYPINSWLTVNSVILPASVPYKGLPVSAENALPQTLANNPVVQTIVLIFQILTHPEILPFVVLFIVVLVVIAVFPVRRRRKKKLKADS
jgi:hypothetical protein